MEHIRFWQHVMCIIIKRCVQGVGNVESIQTVTLALSSLEMARQQEERQPQQ